MTARETNGVWGRAERLSETAVGSTGTTIGVGGMFPASLACTSPGDCLAVGSYSIATSTTTGATHPAALLETDGGWGRPTELGLPAGASYGGKPFQRVDHDRIPTVQTASLNAVACQSASSCVAVGNYVDDKGRTRPMTVQERGGVWGPATALSLPSGALLTSWLTSGYGASLDSVACPDATTCYAVGQYTFDRSGDTRGLLAIDKDGGWSVSGITVAPEQIRHPTSRLSAITCLGPASCYAFGSYSYTRRAGHQTIAVIRGRGFTDDDGSWRAATVIGNPTFRASSVACAGHGECLAVGTTEFVFHEGRLGTLPALRATALAQTAASRWGPTVTVKPPTNAGAKPPLSYLDRVACPLGGPCVAIGGYLTKNGPAQTIVTTWQPGPPA